MTVTYKERILKAIRGEMADRLAFAPRLDLWHSADARAGTLPPGMRTARPIKSRGPKGGPSPASPKTTCIGRWRKWDCGRGCG